jgi:hypothetical protein
MLKGETMKSNFSKFVFACATAISVLLLTAAIHAQPRVARGRVYTKSDVDRIIKRVEDSTDKFKKEFDKALDRSRLNDTNREDQLNEYAKRSRARHGRPAQPVRSLGQVAR